jgi:hypothetical protein
MRVVALTILAAGMALATTQAPAQTYGSPAFPVCLQVYGRANYVDCSYASIEQCRLSASARAAQCIANPYFAAAQMPEPRVSYHHRYHHRY